MNFEQFGREANNDMVWKMGEPSEYERQFRNLAGKEGLNRNWLESEAYKAGVDFDHQRGFDDEFSKDEFNSN